MTKDSAKELLNNPGIKLAGLVVTQTIAACVLYFGLRSEIRENKATQEGRDNVQDVIIQGNLNAVNALNMRVDQLVSKKSGQ